MADIAQIENVVDLWGKASQNQRNFLMYRRLYPSDNQTCKAIGLNHATPIQWRKRDQNFMELERLYNLQPIETALMYLREGLFPIALATLHRAMTNDNMHGYQVDAAKAVNNLMISLEQLKQNKQPKKSEVSFKRKYDDNTADRAALLPAPDTGDSPQLQSQVESP